MRFYPKYANSGIECDIIFHNFMIIFDWFKMKKEEVVDLVIKLYKEGNSMSKVGLILRDQHSVPSVKVVTGNSIKQILNQEKLLPNYPEDLLNLSQIISRSAGFC